MSSSCRRMTCDVRFLNYLSLVLGLMSFGALALAVATDYWLFTEEPLSLDNIAPPPPPPPPAVAEGPIAGGLDELGVNDTLDVDYEGYDDYPALMMPMTIKVHSGLWRICLTTEMDLSRMDKSSQAEELYPPEPGASDTRRKPASCTVIGYFQSSERQEGAATTWSILRAIRKATPSIVISLIILSVALGFSTVGNSKHDYKTLIGAILYIFSALVLAVGVIFYISVVNDEVSHRKPPTNPEEGHFRYNYGWAFFLAGSSFVTSMICSVTNISLYLRRFSNLEDMVMIIPGLEKQGHLVLSPSREMEESDYDVGIGTQNPTIIL